MWNTNPLVLGRLFLVHWRGWGFPSWQSWSPPNMSEVCDRDGPLASGGYLLMCIFLKKLDMVYVHVSMSWLCIRLHSYLNSLVYDLNQESPFSWMIKTFNASGASDMLSVEHASSFSSCFLKHVYSLSDLGVKYCWWGIQIRSTRDYLRYGHSN